MTVTADTPETDKVFDKWVVLEGSVTPADATKATTTFTMPAGAVKLEATYKDAPPAHTHSYAADWKHDGTNHWHACDCGDKAGTAAHSFQWVIDKLSDSGSTGNTGSGDSSTDKPGKDDATKTPQTGDSSHMLLWLSLTVVSGGAVMAALVVSKKKNRR